MDTSSWEPSGDTMEESGGASGVDELVTRASSITTSPFGPPW